MMLQMTLVAARVLGSIPGDSLNPPTVGAAFRKFNGPVFLGVPRLVFGGIPGLPAIGSLSSRVYNYLGNDDWRDTTAGKLAGATAADRGDPVVVGAPVGVGLASLGRGARHPDHAALDDRADARSSSTSRL